MNVEHEFEILEKLENVIRVDWKAVQQNFIANPVINMLKRAAE